LHLAQEELHRPRRMYPFASHWQQCSSGHRSGTGTIAACWKRRRLGMGEQRNRTLASGPAAR